MNPNISLNMIYTVQGDFYKLYFHSYWKYTLNTKKLLYLNLKCVLHSSGWTDE